MALTSNYNSGSFEKELQEKLKRIHELILRAMHEAGMQFVTEARGQIQDHAQGTYIDQSTNLRNSVQYLIYHNSEVIEESESKFAAENKMAVQYLVKSYGYQLIGVAGMDYASKVESYGYNVISNQKDTCIVDLTGNFNDIQKLIDNG